MNRFRYIVCSLVAALCFVGCGEEEDVFSKQLSQLESFMTGTLALKTEEQASDPSLDVDNPDFFSTHGDMVCRWIKNYYDADRELRPLVESGRTIYLTMSIYEFSFKRISTSQVPLYTNNILMRDLLKDAGLNLEYWNFDPYIIEVGKTPTIKGLAESLEGCREGDIVEIYMTYTMAYGSEELGLIAPDSPLAIHFTIDLVE